MDLAGINHGAENAIAAPTTERVVVGGNVPGAGGFGQARPEGGEVFPGAEGFTFGTEEQRGDLAASPGCGHDKGGLAGGNFDAAIEHFTDGDLQLVGLELEVVGEIAEGVAGCGIVLSRCAAGGAAGLIARGV